MITRSGDSDLRSAAEQWFLRRGLPAVLRPGTLVRGVWSRSAPALAAFAVSMAFSIVIVAVTAMPNAYASAAELRKAKTRISTATISTQLIHGT